MNLVDILLLSVALGIDCLVVSFSQGLIFTSARVKNSSMLAVTMGFFQGVMLCIGYFATGLISSYVAPFARWIVFLIFTALAIKFIYEAYQEKDEEKRNIINGLNFARKVIATQECDFLILDEILGLLDNGITTADVITDILKLKDESMRIIMTGRKLPRELLPYVDSITTLTTEETAGK